MKQVLIWMLGLCLLFVGVSCKDGSGATPIAGRNGALELSFDLATEVPLAADHFQVVGLDRDGKVVYGPSYLPKTAELKLTGVPLSVTKVEVTFLIGTTPIGMVTAGVDLAPGSAKVDFRKLPTTEVERLQSLAVSPTSAEIAVGGVQNFHVAGLFSDGASYDLTTLATWSTSAPAVAIVDAGGRATGVAAGTVTIAASLVGITSNGAQLTVVAAVAPAQLPTITSVTPREGPDSGGTMVTIAGRNLLGATAVSFGGTAATSFEVDSDTQVVATSPVGTAGGVNVQVSTPKGTSTASDAGRFTYFALPSVQSVAPSAGKQAGGEAVVITGRNFTGVTSVKFGGNDASAFTVSSSTQISATAPSGAGLVDVTVASEKGSSASGTTARYRYLPIPVLASLDPGNGPEVGGNPVVLTGSGFADVDAVMFGSAVADFTIDSDTKVTATAPAGSGTVRITVRTPGGTSEGLDYAYRPIPALTELAPLAGPEVGGNTVKLFGSGFTSATGVTFGAVAATSYDVVSDSELHAVAPAGTGTARVTVATSSGFSNALDYRYAPVPVVGSASATVGSSAGGNPITLRGTGLSGTSAVRFGSVAASSFVVVSDTEVTAIAPAGSGTVSITVVTPGGVSAATSYQYLPIPALTSVLPALGAQVGGAVVNLIGSRLNDATDVRFGAQPALAFTVLSETQISATVPAGTGAVDVTVVTPGGTTNAINYTYLAAPTLASVAPTQGPLQGGNPVQLVGERFTWASEVRFGALAAPSFTVVSETRIDATPPAGTGSVMVTVVTPGGASNEQSYAYVPGPALVSLTPVKGPEAGGNTVTLSGGDFSSTTAVSFGATPATSFTVVSAGQIDVVAPAGTGAVDVTVTNAGGTSNALSYTHVPRPEIDTLTPAAGRSVGGSSVTITGVHLTGASEVHFGTVPATSFTVVSDTQITAIAGPGPSAGVVDVSVRTAGGTSDVLPFTYSTVLPVIASLSPGNGPSVGGNTVTIFGSGFTDATNVSFGNTPTPFTLVSDTQITVMPPAGMGMRDVTVTTLSGLSNPYSYAYVPPPTLDAVTPSAGPEAGGNTVILDGESLDLVTSVKVGGVDASFTVDSDEELSVQIPAGSAGVVDITVTNLAGSDTLVGGYEYVPAPTLSAVSPTVGGTAGGTTVTITGSNLLATDSVSFGTTPAASFTAVSPTQVTAVSPAGTGTVDVTLSSAGGSATLIGAFRYAGTPAITSLSPTAGPAGGGNTLTITGTDLDSATGVHFLGFGMVPAATVTATQVTVVVPGLAGGATYSTSVITAGGESNTLSYQSVTPPLISSLTPTAGPVLGGTSVTIAGSGFTSTDQVTFDGVAATSFTVDNAGQITAVAPAGLAGPVDVVVSNPGGSSTSVGGFAYFPAPGLGGLSSMGGAVSGGETVTLTGTNFAGATQVLFGSAPATNFTVVSPTQIVAVTPAGVSGGVSVSVTTPGGTSNALSFDYVDAPAISQISPSSGPVAGGNTVSLEGLALETATAVLIGGATASFTVVDDEELTVVIPAGSAGVVDVEVQTLGGSETLVGGYEYVPVPALSAVSPSAGVQAGGTAVTLTGTNLLAIDSVSFGATPATSFTVVSPTQVTAVSPAGTGTVDVTVSSAGGSATLTSAFRYAGTPAITSLSPTAGPAGGGNTLTITGTDLDGATSVHFLGFGTALVATATATQVTVVVPGLTGGATYSTSVITAGGESNTLSYQSVTPPLISSLTPTAGPVLGGTSVTILGSGFTGTDQVTFDGVAATSFTVDNAGQITAIAPAGAPGPVDVVVSNPGGSSTSADGFAYYPAPGLGGLSSMGGAASGGETVTLTGTNFAGATQVLFGSTPASGFTVVSPTQIVAMTPAGMSGGVSVSVTTPGGTSNALSYDYVDAPVINQVSPSQGPLAGGNTISIDGLALETTTAVLVGGATASFTVVDDEELTVVVPAGNQGFADVEVQTLGGITTAYTAYNYVPAPDFVFSPDMGREAGGDLMTLNGIYLAGVSEVKFGSTSAMFQVISPVTLNVTTPPGTGTVDVTVTTPGGSTTKPASFTYEPIPTISSISPNVGPVPGGVLVTITGTGLTNALQVAFGGNLATPSSSSSTQLTVVVPAGSGAGAVNVVVSTPGGDSNALTFTYYDAPSLSAVNPTSGSTAGGNTVTLTGNALTGTTDVTFDGVPASFTFVSDTQIDAIAPTATGPGAVDIVVVSPGGSATAVTAYTYATPPTISGLLPAAGGVAGGNVITVLGTNLLDVSDVSVGSMPAVGFIAVSPTQLEVTMPSGTGPGPVSLTVTSAAGTSNAVTFTYVTAASLADIDPPAGPEAGGNTVLFDGDDFTTVENVRFDGYDANFTIDSDEQLTVIVPAGYGTVDVDIVSAAGTSTFPGAYTYVPPAYFMVLPANGRESGGESITLSGANLLTATEVKLGSTPAMSFTIDSDSQITVVTPAGTGTVDVTVITPAGEFTEGGSFVYVPPPVTTSLSDAIGPSSGNSLVTIVGSHLDTVTAVRVNGMLATVVGSTPTDVTILTPASPPSTGTVEVITVGGSASNLSYEFVDGPTISSVTPNEGAEAGGTTVTITGTSFSSTTKVYFDGLPVSFTVVSDTQLTVVSPATSFGTVDVSVENPGGLTTASGAFTYVPAPMLNGIVENAGPVAGGTSVRIFGNYLANPTDVSFGGVPASFVSISSSQIEATLPAHLAGPVPVTVTTAGGTGSGVTFTYVDPPSITSLSQTSGDVFGGYGITIYGTNLNTTLSVHFDQALGTGTTVVSDTEVSVMVPSGSLGLVDVSIETFGGSATASGAFTYTP